MKGVKRTTMRLADGSTVTYFYAWRGGPRLPGQPGDPGFLAAFNEAIAGLRPKSSETLSKIFDGYLDSQAFAALAPRSAKDYRSIIKKIEKKFGDFPLAALGDRRARAEFLTWRDELAKTSRRGADYTFAIFARALSWGVDFGHCGENPLKKHGNTWKGNRNDHTWSAEDEVAMLAALSPSLQLAMRLALWTAQRQGDILRMTWTAYDGELLAVRQGKTGKTVHIPVAAPLKAELDAAPRSGLYIVEHDGFPYTSDGFRSVWSRAMTRAGLDGANLTFHDLRGTFATRAYEASATDAEVASVTGHGADGQAHATLRRHYLSLNLALARVCIRKLETRAAALMVERMDERESHVD